MKRLLAGIIFIGLILWVHPIAGLFAAIVFALLQPYPYYEIVILGVLIDAFYHTIVSFSFFNIPVYTVSTILTFLILGRIQKSINMYA